LNLLEDYVTFVDSSLRVKALYANTAKKNITYFKVFRVFFDINLSCFSSTGLK